MHSKGPAQSRPAVGDAALAGVAVATSTERIPMMKDRDDARVAEPNGRTKRLDIVGAWQNIILMNRDTK
jgi:hypothetical protein